MKKRDVLNMAIHMELGNFNEKTGGKVTLEADALCEGLKEFEFFRLFW
jgi:hypothetical protein